MYKAVAIMLVIGTVVGVMMPATRSTPAAQEAQTVTADQLPVRVVTVDRAPQEQQVLGNEIRLRRQSNGHFYADAQVNGMTVNFIVDTGASGIALTRSDAQRAGLQFNSNEFQVVGEGASGPVWGKFVTLERVSLGGKSVRNVDGAILDGGEQSLLGQNFLSQFGSVEIRGDTMVLR